MKTVTISLKEEKKKKKKVMICKSLHFHYKNPLNFYYTSIEKKKLADYFVSKLRSCTILFSDKISEIQSNGKKGGDIFASNAKKAQILSHACYSF